MTYPAFTDDQPLGPAVTIFGRVGLTGEHIRLGEVEAADGEHVRPADLAAFFRGLADEVEREVLGGMTSTEGLRALLVPVEGPLRDVVLATDQELAELRRYTGAAYFERTRGPADADVWVDEEGALPPTKPINRRLSRWAARRDDWQLRGDAVITGPADDEGDMTSLSAAAAAELRAAIEITADHRAMGGDR